MMITKLISLTLTNFKGAKHQHIDFNEKETSIFGDNATGKTRIFDAFTWLMFGKDSSDRKDFEIKSLDSDNNSTPKIEHEVKGVISVDGLNVELKRIFKEKWTKKKGNPEPTFTGNETLFYVDDVPFQAGEYAQRITSIIDEKIFKLITNPFAFNSLKWQERRAILMSITGELSNEDIAETKKEFQILIDKIAGKDIEEYKRGVSAKKKKLKKDLDEIPTRVDELHRNTPEAPDYDFHNKSILEKEERITKINAIVKDKSEASKQLYEKKEANYAAIDKLKEETGKIKMKVKVDCSSDNLNLTMELKSLKTLVEGANNQRKSIIKDKEHLEQNNIQLSKDAEAERENWHTVNNSTISFDEKDFSCPTCNREFADDDVEAIKKKLEENFNNNKIEKLKDITSAGKTCVEKIENNTSSINDIETTLIELDANTKKNEARLDEISHAPESYVSVESILLEHKSYQRLLKEIKKLESKQFAGTPADDENLGGEIKEIREEIDAHKKVIGVKAVIENNENRVAELKAEEGNLSQQIADLEKDEFVIESFLKVKIDNMEAGLNHLFKTVKFKLFEKQINGGIADTCVTLINGVPFPDANNAAKINTGIEIINVLCNYHEVTAPIFIDNREGVNKLIETNSQIINLIVSKDDPIKIV